MAFVENLCKRCKLYSFCKPVLIFKNKCKMHVNVFIFIFYTNNMCKYSLTNYTILTTKVIYSIYSILFYYIYSILSTENELSYIY